MRRSGNRRIAEGRKTQMEHNGIAHHRRLCAFSASQRISAALAFILLLLPQMMTAAAPKEMTPAQIQKALQEAKPAFTEAQAQGYVREMLPLVEKVAGRKFQTEPKLKLVRRSDLVPVLAEELVPQLKRLYPKASDANVEMQATASAASVAPGLLGKYGTSTKKLYLLPRNFQPLMDFAQVEQKYRQDVVKLVIAHELAHALNDQHVELTQLEAGLDTQEKSLGFAATIEGFAMFVEGTVAEELKTAEAARQMADAMLAGTIKGLEPFREIISKQESGVVSDQYLRGRDFVAWHYRSGGIEQVWRILADPPRETSVIYHPETYASAPKQDVDYAKALDGLEKLIGKRQWETGNAVVGEMEVRNGYAGMSEKDKHAVFPQIVRAQRLQGTSGGSAFRLAIIETRDSSGPSALIGAVERLAKSNFDKLKASKTFKLTPFAPADFTEMKGKADLARRLSFTVSARGESRAFSFYRIARGNIMAELYAEGFTIPGAKAAAVLEELLKRVAQ